MSDRLRDLRLRELREALTERQALFAEEYVANGGNATAAARQAGYSGDEEALAARGYETVRNRQVSDYIEALRDALRGGAPKTLLERVRDRLWLIGSGEPIEQFVRGKIVRMPARASDQRGALRTLAQMLGGLNPTIQVELSTSLRGQLEALRAVMPEEHFLSLLKGLERLSAQGPDGDTIDAEVRELPP